MSKSSHHALLALTALLAGLGPLARASESVPTAEKRLLRILFVGEPRSSRGQAFTEWLEKRFAVVASAERKSFDPSNAQDFDVVLLDWPQRANEEFGPDDSPLGARANWNTPSVLLGSAGLLMAKRWQLEGWFG